MATNREKLETPEYKARLFAFSERLKKEREKLGITQSALAERAGLSGHAVISRWEAVANPVRGGSFTSPGAVTRELPDVNDMLKLCAVFGCEIDYLVGIQDLPTKVATNISSVTGLSETALNELSSMPDSDKNFGPKFREAMRRRADTMSYRAIINFLLSESLGKKALEKLAIYFFAKYATPVSEDSILKYTMPWAVTELTTYNKTALLSAVLQREIILWLATDDLKELMKRQNKEDYLADYPSLVTYTTASDADRIKEIQATIDSYNPHSSSYDPDYISSLSGGQPYSNEEDYRNAKQEGE